MPCSECGCQRAFLEAEQDKVQLCPACDHFKFIHPTKADTGESKIFAPSHPKLIADAKKLLADIKASTVTEESLSDPTLTQWIPFPFSSSLRPGDRFALKEDGSFLYMGRAKFKEMYQEVTNSSSVAMPRINVYGGKGLGKSHLLAAGVVLLIKQGKRVVFLPQARDWATNDEEDYLRTALYLGFADAPELLAEMEQIQGADNLVAWASLQDFILIVDQVNSLEEDSRLEPSQKSKVKGLMQKLCVGGRHVVYGFSANNQTARDFADTQRSERDVVFRTGFDKVEQDSWRQRRLPLRAVPDELVEDLFSLTGAVPKYLDEFFPSLPATPTKFGDFPIHVPVSLPASLSELEKVVDSFAARLSAYVRYLAAEVSGQLEKFRGTVSEKEFFAKADALLRHEVLQGYSHLIDHRFFYMEHGFGKSLCGVATQCLMDMLRAYYKKQASHFLSKAWISACREAPNRSVQCFIAEQIVISAIQSQGVKLSPPGDVLDFKPRETEQFLTKPLEQKQGTCLQYVPSAFNYRKIDSLIRDLAEQKKGKKKPKIALKASVVAFQMTLQPISKHMHSLDFFKEDKKVWQVSEYEHDWHFVWVVSAAERDARMKAETWPRVKKIGGTQFVEHVMSFGDLCSSVDFL